MTAALYERNRQAVAGYDEIDVQTGTQLDGTVAHVVNTPGTKDDSSQFSPIDLNTNDNVTNLITLAGMTTSRKEAIADALALAGPPHDASVMLVGHSQGGMGYRPGGSGLPEWDLRLQHHPRGHGWVTRGAG